MQIEHIGFTRRAGDARQTGNGGTVFHYQIRHGSIHAIISEREDLCIAPTSSGSFENINRLRNRFEGQTGGTDYNHASLNIYPAVGQTGRRCFQFIGDLPARSVLFNNEMSVTGENSSQGNGV